MAYSMIITACPCREDAKALAQTLVKEKLAACVQIQDIESFFTWQGKVENSSEALLFIKTKSELYQKVEEAILKSHNTNP